MRLIGLMIVLISSIHARAQQADQHMYEGNKLYAKGKYKEAAAAYQQAYGAKKNREAQYNLGNAFYQQKNFEKAASQYTETEKNTRDSKLKAASNHNLGNTCLEQKKWDEAIDYYKQSLRQNPSSPSTKYNLAYAQAMKKQQDQQNKNNKKQDQKQDQQKQQPDKQPQDQQQGKDKQDPQQNQKPEQGNQKPEPQPSKLSKEQADQILNALNQEEKKLRGKKEKGSGQPVKLDKDW